MTTPDYPDWSPGTVNVAAGVPLFDGHATPYPQWVIGPLDTRSLNSVDITIANADLSAFNPIAVEAIWTTSNRDSGRGYYTVGNGFCNPRSDSQSVLSLPCLGDSLTVQLASAAGAADTDVFIAGSARTLGKPQTIVTGRENGSILAIGSGVNIAAGATLPVVFGPVSGPVGVALLAPNGFLLRAYTWALSGGAWQSAIISPRITATGIELATSLDCPGRILQANITNNTGAAGTVNYSITEGS
jgi:hypothetical protein